MSNLNKSFICLLFLTFSVLLLGINGVYAYDVYSAERKICLSIDVNTDICIHTNREELCDGGHTGGTPTIENAVLATCTAGGSYDEVIYCTVCNAEISRTNKVEIALGHNWEDKWTTDLEPTCKAVGSASRHCTRCDAKTDSKEILKAPHKPVAMPGNAASCTTMGRSHGSCCSVCGEILVPCVAQPMTPHSEIIDEGIVPDCTHAGLTEGKHCAVCNAVLVAQEVIDALGHAYKTDWTTDLEPTCTTLGSKSHHCARCDDKADVTEIPVIPHTYEEWSVTVMPDFDTVGEETRVCSVCAKPEVRQIVLSTSEQRFFDEVTAISNTPDLNTHFTAINTALTTYNSIEDRSRLEKVYKSLEDTIEAYNLSASASNVELAKATDNAVKVFKSTLHIALCAVWTVIRRILTGGIA